MNENSEADTYIRLAKYEFLLDEAAYFQDKKDLYLRIKLEIAKYIPADVSEIRICGSAYWGRSFAKDRPFTPGESDLDAAIISPSLYCRCMAEVRDLTKDFADQTHFPATRRSISTYDQFLSYSFKKGMIRGDLLPPVKTKMDLQHASEEVSRKYLEHFEKISFVVYDSMQSFAVKQARATEKFRG